MLHLDVDSEEILVKNVTVVKVLRNVEDSVGVEEAAVSVVSVEEAVRRTAEDSVGVVAAADEVGPQHHQYSVVGMMRRRADT